MEVNVKLISNKCRLCTQETQYTGINIFSTNGLQLKIRKYLQITIKSEDYLPKVVCGSCFQILEGFDRLCGIASNAQKELLLMLNEAKINTINGGAVEGKSKTRTRRKKNKSGDDNIPGQSKKKKRLRKQKTVEDDASELSNPPKEILGLPAVDVWANLKLGQMIRDTELIRLILKALKWTDNEEDVERLRNTDVGEILSNSDLLHDEDLMRLIKSYMGYDGNNNSTDGRVAGGTSWNPMDHSVTEMEVKVDPSLFLPEDETDDSRTISVDLNELICSEKFHGEGFQDVLYAPFECTSCPERFVTNVQLQDHVLTHLIKRSQDAEAAAKNNRKPKKKRTAPDTKTEKENDPTKTCPYCQKQFKRRQDLKFHINQHTGERPYKCVSCPKAFASSGNCLTHRKRMHPELFQKRHDVNGQ